jgi:ERF superfamily
MCRGLFSQTAEPLSSSEDHKPMSAKIALALHNVMTKVTYVQKGSENKFHGYKYVSEGDLLEKLRPALIEEGLILIPSVDMVRPLDEHGNTVVDMRYEIVHKDGDIWPHPIRISGCGNDRAKSGVVGDKGIYKAITGANKYFLFKLFQIETGDDPERDTAAQPEPQTKATPWDNYKKDLMTYMRAFELAVDMCETVKDVQDFWKQELKENFETMKIEKDGEDYEQLRVLCSDRVKQINEAKRKVKENGL